MANSRESLQLACDQHRDDLHPSGLEQTCRGFHHATPNGSQFKTYALFISEVFHLLLLDHCSLQVTESTNCKTMDKWGLLYFQKLKFTVMSTIQIKFIQAW